MKKTTHQKGAFPAAFFRMSMLGCLIVLFSLLNLRSSYAQSFVEQHGQLRVQGNRIVDQGGDPVQLTGMALYWSQWIPKYYNYNTIKWLRDDWCINVIRASIAIGSGGYETNPTREMDKVFTVVDAAVDLGIYVIVDFHDHHAEDKLSTAQQFFRTIAQRYGNIPNILYETYNEPLNVSWSNVLKPYHEAVISTIRQYDPDNIIICGTRNWSQQVNEASLNPIRRPNIAYTLHYYAATHKQWLRDNAQSALNNGIALFVTEYGTTEASGNGFVDAEESRRWWDFLNRNYIGHCNWSVADISESSAALMSGASVNGGWSLSQIKPSGRLVRDELRSRCSGPSCTPTTIVPYVRINDGTWASASTATLTAGGTVMFGPQPVTGGSWSWSGPNGFSASSREVLLENIQSTQAGNYVATYTNSGGCNSKHTFTVTVTTPSNQAPAVSLTAPANNATYTAPASIVITATAADTDGSISNVSFYNGTTLLATDATAPYSFTWNNVAAGSYSITARATDNSGAVTTSSARTVSVSAECTPTTITPYVRINGGAWAQSSSATLTAGGDLMFGPQPVTGGSWSWSGPNGYSAATREISLNDIQSSQAGSYVATYTNTGGCKSSNTFVVTVNDAVCPTEAVPAASEFVVRNDWSDQNAGSGVSNTSDALRITHRSWGRNRLWVLQSGNTMNVTAGETYTISFDFRNDAGNPVTSVDVGFGTSVSWDGPVLAQSVVAAPSGYSSSSYTSKTVTFTANSTGTVFLVFRLNWPGQPNAQVTTYLKNISVCSASSTALRAEADAVNYSSMPNPFEGNTVVVVNDADTVPLKLVVSDFSGTVVYESSSHYTNESVQLGDNFIAGVYVVQAFYNGTVVTFRIMKN